MHSGVDLRDPAGADGAATFTDREPEALFHGDRLDELHAHLGVVAGHNHLGALGQRDDAGDVRGAEVELRAVVGVERVVTPTLVFAQDVHLGFEVGVRGDGAGLDGNLAARNLFALGTAQEEADVLAGFGVVEQLAEHLDTGDGGLDGLVVQADDLHLVVDVELPALDPAGDDGSTTGDREDVFDRHEERLVDVTDRVRDVLVDGVHEVFNRLDPLRVPLEGLEAGDPDHGGVVTREVLGGQEFSNFHLDEVEELFVVHHVALVQGDEQVGNTHLAGEEHVLAGLRHRTVGRGDDEERPVHLRGTGDHVHHVVGVTGGVDVCVVALLGLVLNVRGGDGDTTLALFGSVVHLVERAVLVQVGVLVSENLGDRRRQGRLPEIGRAHV